MATIPEQIEDALIALLAAKRLGEPEGYARTVRSFVGDIKTARRALIVPMPAFLVSYAGAVYRCDGGDCLQTASLWDVIVGDDSHRGEQARRRGAGETVHPGTYQMLEDVRALLLGHVLLSNTQPFELIEERRLEAAPESISAFVQRWQTRYLEQ